MLQYWIWLAQRKGLGNQKKLELAERFSSLKELYEETDYPFGDIPEKARASLLDKDMTDAQRILDKCVRCGIQLVSAGDAQYPKRLLAISDPPLVLYYKGHLPDFDREAAIGVVGTRRASAYGLMIAQKLSRQIAAHGGLVVSGLAAGIDAQAAWGALQAGCSTVAVLGGGVDHIYPAQNRELYRQVEKFGCLLSEYPPGTRPTQWTFPKRNRIISGLSLGVLVVEAPEGSGTMITAKEALKQGRDLYVVPGQLDSEFCVGSNSLLQSGGRLATCGWDALRDYANDFPQLSDKEKTAPVSGPAPPKAAPAQPVLNLSADTPVPEFMKTISPQEQTILDVLAGGDMTYDQIIHATGLEARIVSTRVGLLEIKGLVKTLPGRRAALADREET